MELLDGKKLSQQIKDEIKKAVATRIEKGLKIPHLAAVLVGNDGASLTYVGSKVRSCEQVGFKSTLIRLEDSISENDSVLIIDDLIATGGTAEAAAKLIEISKGKVAAFIFVINLFDLGGCENLVKNGYKVENLMDFPGH